MLDLLYFHLHGRRALIDIYSDINVKRLDQAELEEYLLAYSNSKFVMFARDLLLTAKDGACDHWTAETA